MSEIRLDFRGRIATVILDRPPLNILDLEALAQLDSALDRVSRRPGLQLVVVRAAGTRAFSAGVAVEDHTPDKIGAMLGSFHSALRRVIDLAPLTVAAVDGHCLGGGMELAACCDLVVATGRSTFGQPEIRLSCFPPVAAALSPALLGPGRAIDLVMTGRVISCAEAAAMGFVARKAPDGGLEDALAELEAEVTASSAAALALAKKALIAGADRRQQFDRALVETERIYLEELARCDDLEEGVRAFIDKRPPVWRHA